MAEGEWQRGNGGIRDPIEATVKCYTEIKDFDAVTTIS
jgi:hypothetical protein